MNRGSVPAFHFSAHGLDVAWQNTVAEAVPVPAIAIRAATATAARPIILTYFISLPFVSDAEAPVPFRERGSTPRLNSQEILSNS